jgi:hypothetical protein
MVIDSKYCNLAKVISYVYLIAFTLIIISDDIYINSVFILHIISLLLFFYIRSTKIELFNKYPLLGHFIEFVLILSAFITGIIIVEFIFLFICTRLTAIFKSLYEIFFGQGNTDGSDNGGTGNRGGEPAGPKGPENNGTKVNPESSRDRKNQRRRENGREKTREEKDRINELQRRRYQIRKTAQEEQGIIIAETPAAIRKKEKAVERRRKIRAD